MRKIVLGILFMVMVFAVGCSSSNVGGSVLPRTIVSVDYDSDYIITYDIAVAGLSNGITPYSFTFSDGSTKDSGTIVWRVSNPNGGSFTAGLTNGTSQVGETVTFTTSNNVGTKFTIEIEFDGCVKIFGPFTIVSA